MTELDSSKKWKIKQKWVAIEGENVPSELASHTFLHLNNRLPRFTITNRLLAEEDVSQFDYILLCDDDISLPRGFIDNYFDFVMKYDLALAQPARTRSSYIDHHFVAQLDGITARRTRFVEVGPLVTIRRDLFAAFFPFDETSPMGWGYDYAWPCIVERMNLKMGIIDTIPVEHTMRKPAKSYDWEHHNRSMHDYLLKNQHLEKDQAFTILESFVFRELETIP